MAATTAKDATRFRLGLLPDKSKVANFRPPEHTHGFKTTTERGLRASLPHFTTTPCPPHTKNKFPKGPPKQHKADSSQDTVELFIRRIVKKAQRLLQAANKC